MPPIRVPTPEVALLENAMAPKEDALLADAGGEVVLVGHVGHHRSEGDERLLQDEALNELETDQRVHQRQGAVGWKGVDEPSDDGDQLERCPDDRAEQNAEPLVGAAQERGRQEDPDHQADDGRHLQVQHL